MEDDSAKEIGDERSQFGTRLLDRPATFDTSENRAEDARFEQAGKKRPLLPSVLEGPRRRASERLWHALT